MTALGYTYLTVGTDRTLRVTWLPAARPRLPPSADPGASGPPAGRSGRRQFVAAYRLEAPKISIERAASTSIFSRSS